MERYNPFQDLLEKGYILYLKNGTIVSEKAPEFGEVTITFQDGKPSLLKRIETKR